MVQRRAKLSVTLRDASLQSYRVPVSAPHTLQPFLPCLQIPFRHHGHIRTLLFGSMCKKDILECYISQNRWKWHSSIFFRLNSYIISHCSPFLHRLRSQCLHKTAFSAGRRPVTATFRKEDAMLAFLADLTIWISGHAAPKLQPPEICLRQTVPTSSELPTSLKGRFLGPYIFLPESQGRALQPMAWSEDQLRLSSSHYPVPAVSAASVRIEHHNQFAHAIARAI